MNEKTRVNYSWKNNFHVISTVWFRVQLWLHLIEIIIVLLLCTINIHVHVVLMITVIPEGTVYGNTW